MGEGVALAGSPKPSWHDRRRQPATTESLAEPRTPCNSCNENIPTFEELGLPGILRDFAVRPHGLVLVTGPAGSGKSTTLAAMIDYINTQRHAHIICIEDPIEYLHVNRAGIVDQREVFTDTPSFSEALHSVFRQSPDVIMIGEMRDMETMQLALTLAETGHLILATLHTQDTSHAIHRIVDVFPPAHQQQVYTQLSMVLSCVVSQAQSGGPVQSGRSGRQLSERRCSLGRKTLR